MTRSAHAPAGGFAGLGPGPRHPSITTRKQGSRPTSRCPFPSPDVHLLKAIELEVVETGYEGKCLCGTTLRHEDHPPNVEGECRCHQRAYLVKILALTPGRPPGSLLSKGHRIPLGIRTRVATPGTDPSVRPKPAINNRQRISDASVVPQFSEPRSTDGGVAQPIFIQPSTSLTYLRPDWQRKSESGASFPCGGPASADNSAQKVASFERLL